MTFQKRSMFAVLAAMFGVLAATQAGAFPSDSTSPTPDLTLVVWDTSNPVTYFRDLGFAWSGATVSSDFGSTLPTFTHDDNWSNFIAALGGPPTSTTFYDVVSGTVTPSGTQILVTTGGFGSSGPNSTLTAVTGPTLQTAIGNWSAFATTNAHTDSASPNFNSATATFHGSNISVFPDTGEASTGTTPWQNGFGQTDFTTLANVGRPMNFFSMSGGTLFSKATVTKLPNQWLLSAQGDLTYSPAAAVPEPGTWAILLSGLGVVGLFARRRSKRS